MVTDDPLLTSLATDLPSALGPFQRVLRRAVRVGFALPALPDAQVDVLRRVQRQPGVRVGEVARGLGLAANTVSMLVGHLAAEGLLERRQDAGDRRSTALHLTAEAERRLAAWAEHRTDVLREVLASLPDADREALVAALPALARLRTALEDRAATDP